MFKLLIATLTSLGLMFGGAEAIDQVKLQEQTSRQQAGSETAPLPAQTQQQEQLLTEAALQTQTRERLQSEEQTPLCDPALDPLCVPIQDQIRDQTQDQTQLHIDTPQHLNPQGTGDGICDADCTPEPVGTGPHGNGH